MESTCTIQFNYPGNILDGFLLVVSLPKTLQEGDIINLSSFSGLENLSEVHKHSEISKIQWEVSSIDRQPAYKLYLKPTKLDADGNLVYKDIVK